MKISLYGLDQIGIIILDDSGPIYSNQTGGGACMQPSVKGYFVPISEDPPLEKTGPMLFEKLSAATLDMVGLTIESANKVNELLAKICSSDTLEVDIERIQDSHEAWVFINVTPKGDYSIFENATPFKAILTWPNSD